MSDDDQNNQPIKTPAAAAETPKKSVEEQNVSDAEVDKDRQQAKSLKMIVDGLAIALRLAASKAVVRIVDVEKKKKTVKLINSVDAFLVALSCSLSTGIKNPQALVTVQVNEDAGLGEWKLDLEDEHSGEFFRILSSVKEQLIPLVLTIAGSYISQKDIRVIALNNAISSLAPKV